jgi:NADPH:quinone reductase-like Zn-dependent oxidoreductase
VGSIAVQLAARTGATVIGLASESNHAWLRDHGVIPVSYGEGQAERIEQATGGRLDAFIDTFGGGYVELAISLGVSPDRINTIADFAAVERFGVHAEGTGAVGTAARLAEIAGLAADGSLEVPIARTFPLADVREAFALLAERKTRGKIVLIP